MENCFLLFSLRVSPSLDMLPNKYICTCLRWCFNRKFFIHFPLSWRPTFGMKEQHWGTFRRKPVILIRSAFFFFLIFLFCRNLFIIYSQISSIEFNLNPYTNFQNALKVEMHIYFPHSHAHNSHTRVYFCLYKLCICVRMCQCMSKQK